MTTISIGGTWYETTALGPRERHEILSRLTRPDRPDLIAGLSVSEVRAAFPNLGQAQAEELLRELQR
jgi:hypothetical protein